MRACVNMKHQEAGIATERPEDQPPPYEAVPQDLEGIRVNGKRLSFSPLGGGGGLIEKNLFYYCGN
jgi:hypothetical protein